MTWKVNFRDIVRVPPGKMRGSMYSLVRRSSQVVSIKLRKSILVVNDVNEFRKRVAKIKLLFQSIKDFQLILINSNINNLRQCTKPN